MDEVVTKLKKWGNSYGVLLPIKIVNEQKLKENSEVVISVKPHKTLTVGELMELAKKYPLKSKKSTEEIMKEMDYELYGIKR
ncbi:MAG: AbrB/MazE/SpoVT family DNA-binding domain-containing protein [Nanoarchaeota archaeon]